MKRREIKLAEQLSSIPVRNQKVRFFTGDDGESLVVEVALKYPKWMLPLYHFLKMKDFKSYRIEGIGLQVYESIDGKKSFEELIDKFAEHHKLTFFESRALLMQYMGMLMKKGLVVVGMRRGAEDGG